MLHYLAVWDLVDEENIVYYERKETISVERENQVESELSKVEEGMSKPFGGHRYAFRTIIKL